MAETSPTRVLLTFKFTIMKKNLLFLLTAMTLLFPVSSLAQKDATIDDAIKRAKGGKFLLGNYKVTKPLYAVSLDGRTINATLQHTK